MQGLAWVLHGLACVGLYVNGYQDLAMHYSWFIGADVVLVLGINVVRSIT